MVSITISIYIKADYQQLITNWSWKSSSQIS
jgi:hypothetical protein